MSLVLTWKNSSFIIKGKHPAIWEGIFTKDQKIKQKKPLGAGEFFMALICTGLIAWALVSAVKGFLRDSDLSRANQKARLLYASAEFALTEYIMENGTYQTKAMPSEITPSTSESVSLQSGVILTIDEDLGGGYYAFVTNSAGNGIEYALWSEEPFDTILQQTALQQADSFTKLKQNAPQTGIGCYPLSE